MQTIAIVYGGESCEHDVSVITALSAYHVAKMKYQTYLVYYKDNTFWVGDALKDVSFYANGEKKGLRECRFEKNRLVVRSRWQEKRYVVDCVLVACHGGAGENGSLAGYFETIGMPYSSSEPYGSALFMDKSFTKDFLTRYRIPFVHAITVKEGEPIPEPFEYPVIVKPASLGSSVGIGIARDPKELEEKVAEAFRFDRKILLETCLTNFREFNCAVCRKGEEIVASEVEEPVFKKEYLDFYDKYCDGETARRVLPAAIDEKLREKIRATAKSIYAKAELKGVVRVDYLFDGKKLFVNEINTVPGSLALYLFAPLGIRGIDVLRWIIDDAIDTFTKKQKKRSDFSSDVLRNYDEKKGTKGIKGGVKK